MSGSIRDLVRPHKGMTKLQRLPRTKGPHTAPDTPVVPQLPWPGWPSQAHARTHAHSLAEIRGSAGRGQDPWSGGSRGEGLDEGQQEGDQPDVLRSKGA